MMSMIRVPINESVHDNVHSASTDTAAAVAAFEAIQRGLMHFITYHIIPLTPKAANLSSLQ